MKREYREIDIKQLVIVLLLKWKILILFLALGVAIGMLYISLSGKSGGFTSKTGSSSTVIRDQKYDERMINIYDSYIDTAQKMLEGKLAEGTPVGDISFEELEYMTQVIIQIPTVKAGRDAIRKEAAPSGQVQRARGIPEVIICAAAGVFFGSAVIVFYYALSGVVLSMSELTRWCGLRPLSVVSQGEGKRLLRYGRDGSFLKMTIDEQMQIAVANILFYSMRTKEILVTGTIDENSLKSIADEIRKRIADCKIEYVPYINENAASYEKLNSYEHVVVVERILSSDYSGIDKELQLLADWKKNVVGIIGIV